MLVLWIVGLVCVVGLTLAVSIAAARMAMTDVQAALRELAREIRQQRWGQ